MPLDQNTAPRTRTLPLGDTLGREAVLGGMLAEPGLQEQLAALPPDPAPAPAAAPIDQLAALPGDPAPASHVVDTASLAPAMDLTPVMGSVPPAIADGGIGLIKVTMLQPDLGGLGFAPFAPSLAPPLSDPSFAYGYASSAGPSSIVTPRTIPQDHNMIRPAETHETHAAPPPAPEAHANAPAASAPAPAKAVPAGAAAAHAGDLIVHSGAGSDVVMTFASLRFEEVPPPPPPPSVHPLSVEAAPNGGFTFAQDDQLITIAPGGHGTIGSGDHAYALDVGAGGSVSITALNGSIVVVGNSNIGASLTLTNTGTSTLTTWPMIATPGPSTIAGSLTVSSAGTITQSGSNAFAGVMSLTTTAAGYSATEHVTLVAGQPDPHTHT